MFTGTTHRLTWTAALLFFMIDMSNLDSVGEKVMPSIMLVMVDQR